MAILPIRQVAYAVATTNTEWPARVKQTEKSRFGDKMQLKVVSDALSKEIMLESGS